MTLLFCEGFDNMGASDGATYGKWTSASDGGSNNTGSRSLQTGRFGSGSALRNHAQLSFNGSAFSTQLFPLGVDTQTVFVGFAFRDSGSTVNGFAIMQMYDNTQTSQLALNYFITGNTLSVSRGATTLFTTSTLLSPTNTWYWVELGAFISPTAGWAELKVNGTLVGSYYGTGTSRGTANGNTRNTSVSSARFVWTGSSNGTNGTTVQNDYDDLVANDNNGSMNNDFMGNVRVIGLLPNNNGSNSGWTRVGGTASGNYTAVNENPVNGDSSYVTAGITTTEDTYLYPTLPSTTASVLAVVAEPISRIDDTGTKTIGARVKSQGTEATGPTANLSSATYGTPLLVMETNPVSSAAWVVSDVNVVEVGPRVVN